MDELAQRIRDYIARKGRVSMTDILELSKGRYSITDMHEALRIVHRYKDVQVRSQGGDNVYTIRTIRTTTAVPVRDDVGDAVVRDFWENSTLVTDTERACYYARLNDKRHYKTCPLDPCVDIRYMYSSREERAIIEWKRERKILQTV